MKGIIFVALSEMIQEMYGHKAWNKFLSESKVTSKGVYTASEIYDDKEATDLLGTISKELDKSPKDILYIFGIYLIKFLNRKYPKYFNENTFLEFIDSIDKIIHVEILKIYPDITPPHVILVSSNQSNFIIHYSSKRKLCSLAHGLIKGASKIYKVDIEITHTNCMLKGNDCCEFHCTFK
ncbi:MAG: heme NO-binding domain-containing protein [Bdellovibrionales bacterium]|nr:heme NO-binding domain-containing protein [Bdellovibrionales bacterium]